MFLTLQDLKVDQTAIASGNIAILVSNINIPISEFQNLDNVVERVRNFILTDYISVETVLFQVCATYQLKHVETGEIRQWTGSFNPKGNQLNTLCNFQLFSPQFKTQVINACSDENIQRKLNFYHVETSWVFYQTTSIIISVQSVVNLHHPTILRKSLFSRHHGHKGTIQTFYLP